MAQRLIGYEEDKTESLVIGAMVLHPEDIQETSAIISEKDFIIETFKIAFQTLLSMKQDNLEIELYGLYSEMGRHPGLASILAETIDEAFLSPTYYAQLLRKRNLEKEIKKTATERDFESVKEKIKEIEVLGKPANIYNISEMIEIGNTKKSEILLTGFTDIDKIVHFRVPNVMVVAGRPSVGKSSFGLSILSHIAKTSSVGLISFEMDSEGVTERLTENHNFTYLNEINTNFLTSYPFAFNLAEVRKSIRGMRTKADIKLVMIDYLQLMQEHRRFQSRHLEVSHIIRQIPIIAKEFGVAIIMISSLSREGDQRGQDSRPILSSLKESGDIEYAADIVIFINLPKKEKLAEAIVAKNRYKPGKKGIIKLVWLEDRVMFGNYDWTSQGGKDEE